MSHIDDGDFLAFKMVQHPLNADIMLIATSEGMYRSTNGGSSWTKTKTGEYNDVEFLPGSSTAVAAGPTEAIYSLFGGNSWQVSNILTDMGTPQRVEIEVTPDDPSTVYLISGGTTTNVPGVYDGLFKSTNSGQTYSPKHNAPNIIGKSSTGNDDYDHADYDLAMAVSPSDEDKVITWRLYVSGIPQMEEACLITHLRSPMATYMTWPTTP